MIIGVKQGPTQEEFVAALFPAKANGQMPQVSFVPQDFQALTGTLERLEPQADGSMRVRGKLIPTVGDESMLHLKYSATRFPDGRWSDLKVGLDQD